VLILPFSSCFGPSPGLICASAEGPAPTIHNSTLTSTGTNSWTLKIVSGEFDAAGSKTVQTYSMTWLGDEQLQQVLGISGHMMPSKLDVGDRIRFFKVINTLSVCHSMNVRNYI
jgi:hypothetical protein